MPSFYVVSLLGDAPSFAQPVSFPVERDALASAKRAVRDIAGTVAAFVVGDYDTDNPMQIHRVGGASEFVFSVINVNYSCR